MAAKILLYGIGNISRQDDGVGIRFIEEIEKNIQSDQIAVEKAFQLNVEDSLLISEYEQVYFVDASHNQHEKGFAISAIAPSREISFSTHAMKPNSVLAFCHEVYKKFPKVFLLEIQGYEWGFGEELSSQSQINLTKAIAEISMQLETINA